MTPADDRPVPMITPEALAAMIAGAQLDLATEKATQAELEIYLAARLPLGCTLSREHRLGSGDVPDFLVDGRIVVECKANRATAEASLKQLGRYAAHACVEALILVTNKAMCGAHEIGGKPVLTVSLGRAWL